jgi:putative ABC transport system ATP-binding protein
MSKKHNLLSIRKVTKIFSKNTVDECIALDSVSLDVHAGDYITIIGSNGAGKTTLFNIIAGVFAPESGEVIIEGNSITGMAEYKVAKFIGRVHQDPKIGTAGKLTIEENLALAILRGQPRRLRAASSEKRRKLFKEALAPLGLGLENRLEAFVGTLSSGQRQAIALTMATITSPALLMLDEHVANLDPHTAQTVFDLTEIVVKRRNQTTLMITHNMEVALSYGNRLIMMHRGKILVDISGKEKENLSVADLVRAFEHAAGEKLADESILLSCAEI